MMIFGFRPKNLKTKAVAVERGRSSRTALLDAVRLGPADDLTAVTAAQVREVTGRIIAAGHWRDGDPDILVIFDAGYEPARLAWLLKDLPVQVLGRLGGPHQKPQARPGRVSGGLVAIDHVRQPSRSGLQVAEDGQHPAMVGV